MLLNMLHHPHFGSSCFSSRFSTDLCENTMDPSVCSDLSSFQGQWSPPSAYRSLQSGLIGPISVDRVEKKSQCSLPDAHCFILQCLFRCKSVGKSVTSCLCMEGGSLSLLKRKLAKEDCGLGNVWDRILYSSLSDIISFPPRPGILAVTHLPLHSTP